MDDREFLPPITVIRESGAIRVTCDTATAVFEEGGAEPSDAPPLLVRVFRAVMADLQPPLRAE